MTEPSIKLRPAGPFDLALLRHWDEQPHVIAADPNDEWDWENELLRSPDWREQLIAELDGRPIGFLQIIDPAREESHYWGDVPGGLRAIDIWIGEASDLGHGYGTRMMELALGRCFAPPEVTAVLLDPLVENVRAQRFYQRLGFVDIGPRQLGDDRCRVHRLDRATWERRLEATDPPAPRSQPATRSTHRRLLAVTTDLVDRKAFDARTNLRGRECHLLHATHQDPLQRMLNAIQPGSTIRPHRHPPPAGAESLVILKGRLGVLTFDDDGTCRDDDLVVLDPQTANLGADIRAGVWHTVVALEPDTVFFEAKAGPYDPESTEPAPWAPEEGSPEAAEYLDRLVERFRRVSS